MYDLIIIGGGPAGVAAGVYASRKKLKTLFLTESFGGQSIVSDGIENWIGTIKITGEDLAKSLESHLRAYAGEIVDIKTGFRVATVDKLPIEGSNDHVFKVTKQAGKGMMVNGTWTITPPKVTEGSEPAPEESYLGRTILITTGSKRRKLEAKGADIFEHKGVTYCATCDGPMFTDQDVVVVGGGNAAFESAAQLSAYCKSVTIMNRSDKFRADPVTVEKILAKHNIKALTEVVIEEVKGTTFAEGITYKDLTEGTSKHLATTGIFIEIGMLPNTDFVKDLVSLDSYGKVKIDHKSQQTSLAGVWAAGDCTDCLYHQNNIAAGDAVKALEDIYVYLSKK